MRKTIAAVMILLLCLAALPGVRAEEYPPFQGIVADMAGVLGEDAAKDLTDLAGKLEAAVDGRVYVLTRHFLGGASPQSYADQVFRVWNLKENDILLLMVVGEESYAVALGDLAKGSLTKESLDMLMANHFRAAFLKRDYSRAAGETAVALAQALAKAQGTGLNVTGLPGAEEEPIATPEPQTWEQVWQGMFAQNDYQEKYQDWNQSWEQEEHKSNWGSIIIWILVIYFLFFRKKRRGRR
ncbi:MAG: TPM domain-containing protein [Clostridiales bacterium]|nr:TPM domain-containing protein [Clostridiales bacterium]